MKFIFIFFLLTSINSTDEIKRQIDINVQKLHDTLSELGAPITTSHANQAIDLLDEQMLDLLVQRFSVSREIGKIKASGGINVGDPNREQEIIDRLAEKLEGKLNINDIAAIFGPIYHISKKIQKK